MNDEQARRERELAVAALESSPTVHPHADESTTTAAHPVVPPHPRGPSAGAVGGGVGVFAVLTALDQWLRSQGVTLADLTMKSGPLSGGLVANGSLIALGLVTLWWMSQRWQEHVQRTDARAHAQDRNANRQVRAIRAVAAEVAGLRGEVSQQAAAQRELASAQSTLAGRMDAVERDVRDLRDRVPERRPRAN